MSRIPRPLLAMVAFLLAGCDTVSPLDREVAAIVISVGDREAPEVAPGVVRYYTNDGTFERIGERLPDLTVEVRNADGRAVPGIELTLTPSHDGSVRAVDAAGDTLDGPVVTDRHGRARFAWTLGWTLGEQTLTVETTDGKSVAVMAKPNLPFDVVITATLADSTLTVGESTQASATLTTATGRVIDYPYGFHWRTMSPAVATIQGGNKYTVQGGVPDCCSMARDPIGVTGVAPGRTTIRVHIDFPSRVGGQTSRMAAVDVVVEAQAAP